MVTLGNPNEPVCEQLDALGPASREECLHKGDFAKVLNP
jgi:hypothetical protein